ncbi:MAG TPA: 2OG-Fe(II) oxygenase, partial [Urbifossiella sp.]|nr:2OG-Fe(II) oxygenase [Urbifossiella sp.]
MLTPGDPAPYFTVRSTTNERFVFDTIGGRYVVLCFFGSAADPAARRVLDDVAAARARFDPENVVFLGVSTDPDDERLGRVCREWPGAVYFWDFDRAVSRMYGAAPADGPGYRPHTVVLTPSLRVVTAAAVGEDPAAHVPALLGLLDSLPPVRTLAGFAPVLVLPGVFEPDFCRLLVGLYDRNGGRESGFMREVDGRTVEVTDHGHKRRADYDITDPDVIRAARTRLHRRVVPEIRKAFQFDATRVERHIVACYDAAVGGHFRRHRDNTTKGTAHRRFAVTVNLNAHEYEGGDLRFPEFGPRTYRAPTGGAVVFSCSLLHEATPVTRGKRYAYLPFLYDEAAAKVREENRGFIGAAESQPPAE